MSNHKFKALLAQTLCESLNSYTVDELVSKFGSPQCLLNASEKELMSVKGIGKVKAKQLMTVIRFAQLLNTPAEEKYIIRCPKDVFELLRYEIGFLHQEHFVVLFLSTKNSVIKWETLFIGSLNQCIATPREIYKAACRHSAASIIIAHNHPSGFTDPSPEDIQLSKRVRECGELMGIELLDSIVISGTEYTSLKERGLL